MWMEVIGAALVLAWTFSRASIEAALDAYLGCWVFLVALVPLRTPRAALPAPGAPVSPCR
jgi:hypothetical protein